MEDSNVLPVGDVTYNMEYRFW